MELMRHPYRVEGLKNQTGAEKGFHVLLRKVIKNEFADRRVELGLGIQCQIPISHPRGFYLLDFYIPSLRLAFEVDGGYHLGRIDKDLERDEFLIAEKHIIIHHIPNFYLYDKKLRRQVLRPNIVKWINQAIQRRKRNKIKWQAMKSGWRKASEQIVVDSGKVQPLSNEEAKVFFKLGD